MFPQNLVAAGLAGILCRDLLQLLTAGCVRNSSVAQISMNARNLRRGAIFLPSPQRVQSCWCFVIGSSQSIYRRFSPLIKMPVFICFEPAA